MVLGDDSENGMGELSPLDNYSGPDYGDCR